MTNCSSINLYARTRLIRKLAYETCLFIVEVVFVGDFSSCYLCACDCVTGFLRLHFMVVDFNLEKKCDHTS